MFVEKKVGKPHNAANAPLVWGRGVPNRRRWYCWVGRRYVPIGFNTNHRSIWHSLAIICDASFNSNCGKGAVVGLKMGSLSSWVVTSYQLPITQSHRFRSAPTCHGRTDRRNWSSKRRQIYWPPNSWTLHWNWPLVHTAKHCYRSCSVVKNGQRSDFVVQNFFTPFNANINNAAAVAAIMTLSLVKPALYVSSSSLLLLLSAVRHNAFVWAPIRYDTIR